MPDPGIVTPLYPARPELRLGDDDSIALANRVRALVVEERSDGLRRCEATLSNWGPTGNTSDYLYFDRQALDFGMEVAVTFGVGEAEREVFNGLVSAIEGRFLPKDPPEVLLLAEDRLQDLRTTRRTRTFEDTTDAEVFEAIAGEHGLQPSVDLSGPRHRTLAQVNQSDLAFMRARADRLDAALWLEDKELIVRPRSTLGDAEVSLTYGQGLLEASVIADLAGQSTGFVVSGWDVARKEPVRHRATDSVIASELSGDVGGGRILSDAFGDRDQQIVHDMPLTDAEARALADSYFRRDARRFVTARCVSEGDARLRVGIRVELRGLGPLLSGRYEIDSVEHVFDEVDGFRSEFTAHRPGVGSAT